MRPAVKRELQKRYELCYWGLNQRDASQLYLKTAEVSVPSKTMSNMTVDYKPPYYRFIVGDGEDFIISADCVVSIREITVD